MFVKDENLHDKNMNFKFQSTKIKRCFKRFKTSKLSSFQLPLTGTENRVPKCFEFETATIWVLVREKCQNCGSFLAPPWWNLSSNRHSGSLAPLLGTLVILFRMLFMFWIISEENKLESNLCQSKNNLADQDF